MKRLNGNYMQIPHLFWVKKSKATGKFDRAMYGHSLSVNAKWLFITLKEQEHVFTGEKNNSETLFWEGVDNPKNWFYCANDVLAMQSTLGLTALKSAKKELIESKLIKTCRVYKVHNGKKDPHWITGYYIHDGLKWDDVEFTPPKSLE